MVLPVHGIAQTNDGDSIAMICRDEKSASEDAALAPVFEGPVAAGIGVSGSDHDKLWASKWKDAILYIHEGFKQRIRGVYFDFKK